MRIVTFNVNGLRSIIEYYQISKGWKYDEFLHHFEADLICFQEHKINEATKMKREWALPKGFIAYADFQKGAKKIGYSGVVTYCRRGSWEPIDFEEGLTGADSLLKELDKEGRCIITDHGHFILLNVYFPNDSGPERDEYRLNFYEQIKQKCKAFLEAGRSVILLGDINVASHPMDHVDYSRICKETVNQVGWEGLQEEINTYLQKSPEERSKVEPSPLVKSFYGDRLLRDWIWSLINDSNSKYPFIDAFRLFHPTKFDQYTGWNTQMSCRGTNHGTRLDYILLAGPLFTSSNSAIKDCGIMPNVMGSDHCPVYIDLDLEPFERSTTYAVPLPRSLKFHHEQRSIASFFTATQQQTISEKMEQQEEEVISISTSSTTTTIKSSTKITTNNHGKLSNFFEVTKRKRLASLEKEDTIPAKVESITEEIIITRSAEETKSTTDWKQIFKAKEAPRCRGHQETCKLLTVNKKGPNQGRKFYTCARGIGDKMDPSARCDHFEWAK